jgi:hypothetical protein
MRLGPYSELTIASGAITVTGSYHEVDTENDDASDTLSTINGGGGIGDLLLLKADHSDRTVIIAEGGNISLDAAGSFSMDHANDRMLLVKGTTTWMEISRSNNA